MPKCDDPADLFEQNFKELRKWVDVKSYKYGLLLVLRERRCGRLGTALKVKSILILNLLQFSVLRELMPVMKLEHNINDWQKKKEGEKLTGEDTVSVEVYVDPL